jgi:hypothetical protein
MSMNCTSSANHADVSTTLITGAPVAFGLAVKTTKQQARKFFSIAGSSVADIMSVGENVSAADGRANLYIASSSPSGSGQNTSIALTDNTWQRPLVSFNTTNSREVWVDGANKVSATGIFTPVGLSQWILSGRPGDHTQNIGGLAAQLWVCAGVLLDDVEKQFLGKGGHPFGTNCTDYFKLNRVSGTSIPNEYAGRPALVVTGTFTLGADDPNSATWYIGGDIGNQSWNQNSPIVSIAVSTAFDTVNSAFTLGLMKVNASSSSSTTTTGALATAGRVVPLTDVSNINPGDYVQIGSNAQTRVNDVIVTSGVAGKVLIRSKQTFASGAAVSVFKVAAAAVAGVTFGNNISGTPTGTQATTGGYFMRTTCTADPTNLRLQQDSNIFSIAVVAIPVAPSFSVQPAIQSVQADGYTVAFSPNTACTAVQMVLAAGSAQPTAPVLKAQATGLAKASKSVTGADTLTTTGLDFPINDIWTMLTNGLGDSAIVALLGIAKVPTSGKVYRTFTSIDSGTRYAGNCIIGDIEETDARVNPSNVLVTYLPDGNESFIASGRQLRVSRVYSRANKGWILDDAGQILSNVWYNDIAPVFAGAGTLFIVKLNTPQNLAVRSLWQSIDRLTIATVDALPAGLTLVDGAIIGQVSVNSFGIYSMLGVDLAGVATVGQVTIIAGTLKVPRLLFLSKLDAIAVLTIDHLTGVINEQDDDGPPGIVLGQDPAPNVDVNPLDTVTLTVSKTPAGQPPYYGLRNHSFQVVPKSNGDLDLSDPTGV